jgi:glycosyltransferase involved in cell wall biosynthesis
MIRNWNVIDYPREKLEWIIIDDSDNNKELRSAIKNLPDSDQIKYIYTGNNKSKIGHKRNELARIASGKYIVHMDDDDFYPRESVATRIRVLMSQEQIYKRNLCFGCTKVQCMDLYTCQMFEAYDPVSSIDNRPATISESTMAYSKEYYLEQGFDSNSVITECLPFINGREDTIVSCIPSFIITQFTHSNNTVNRKVNRSQLSFDNGDNFLGMLTAIDHALINDIRVKLLKEMPSFKKSIEFITRCDSLDQKAITAEIERLERFKSYDILENPMTIDFIRTKLVNKHKTSGKDLVYYCGPGDNFKFENEWNPETDLGGSEEAVVNLSFQLSSLGYNVTVYCVLKGTSRVYTDSKGNKVLYKPYWNWIPGNKQDFTVIWRDPSNCKQVLGSSNKVLLDLHDAISPKLLDNLDPSVIILIKSDFHRDLLGLDSSINNHYIIPNGIKCIKTDYTKKDQNLIVCTSSPDRCLSALLKILPIVRKEIPDAKIHWAYGWKSGISKGGIEADNRKIVKDLVSDLKRGITETEGFTDLGRLSQDQVEDLYRKANVFLYPTVFPEIDCISLTKAMSAGAIPVVTGSGAMFSKINNVMEKKFIEECSLKVSAIDTALQDQNQLELLANEVISILSNINTVEREKLRNHANNLYNWSYIASKWNRVLTSK